MDLRSGKMVEYDMLAMTGRGAELLGALGMAILSERLLMTLHK
jgi:hypothetical protein